MLGFVVLIGLFCIPYIIIKLSLQKKEAILQDIVSQSKAKDLVDSNRRIQLRRDENIFSQLGHDLKLFTTIVELYPLNDNEPNDKYYFPYLWRQICLHSIDRYPRSVKGIVTKVDIRHNQTIKLTVNQSVSVDFTDTTLPAQFMTLSEFDREQQKIDILYQIDKLSKDIRNLSELNSIHKKKIFLWNSYFSVLPVTLFKDMNINEIHNIVERILILSVYRIFNKKTSPNQLFDIVAINGKKTYIAVQFKKYLNNTLYSLIQENNIDRSAYLDVQSWVISNSSFNSNDEFEAMTNDIRLIDWEKLAKMCIGRLSVNNEIPKFNEKRFKEIETFASKEFKYSDSDLLEIYSPFDPQIDQHKKQLIVLHQKKIDFENLDIE